jgi:hypothetical protein
MRAGTDGRFRPKQVDEVVEHWPVRYRSRAHVFGEPERVDAAEPSKSRRCRRSRSA